MKLLDEEKRLIYDILTIECYNNVFIIIIRY